jgi:CMP-N-acetylneuraminic acid synthetase
MNNSVVAFLPCRRGSQRVVNKNTRPFAGIEGGLIQIKMEQLLLCPKINRIVVSTDDSKVMDIADSTARAYDKPVSIFERPAHLASSDTSTDELIAYLPELINEGIVLWTHVTSPFVTAQIYSKAISAYWDNAKQFDSLMSVTKLQSFIWDKKGPVNYDYTKEKWPRTQTLPVWYEVNSAVFIADISIYIENKDRIGKKPFLFELEGIEGFDIDWEKDFFLAQKMVVADKGIWGGNK